MKSKVSKYIPDRGILEGYKSGLEVKIAEQIAKYGLDVKYETEVVEYIDPSTHKYHPDFFLPNGIYIETKGRFTGKDRRKHQLVKKQHPELDIRFVFSIRRTRLSKTSQNTLRMWCEKNGFIYADKVIPDAWFNEFSNMSHD
jgi:hypothetical protein